MLLLWVHEADMKHYCKSVYDVKDKNFTLKYGYLINIYGTFILANANETIII